jgi:L-alanine-DL-glutamate epimerase-like enolase superfamily enzyme
MGEGLQNDVCLNDHDREYPVTSANTIVALDCIPMRLPFHHWAPPPMFAGRPRDRIDSALVRLATRDGTVAWGEAYSAEPRALKAIFETLVTPLAMGKDASDPALLPVMQRTLHNLGRSGPVVHALAGLDIALWDLRGKREGVPVHALLGGRKHQRVRAYASLLQYYGDAARIDEVCTRAMRDGYTEVKLHEKTADAVAAARKAVGRGVPVMVDTNCAWLPGEAEDAIAAMAPYDPYWIEEPLWPPEDDHALGQLKQRCPIPLAVGENAASTTDLLRVVDHASADYVQPSTIKLGLSGAWQVSQRCAGTSVRCAPQVAFFGPGFLASLHIIAAQDYEVTLERLYMELAHVPYGASVPVRDGWVAVPDRPGLGAEPEAELAAGLYSA